MTIGYTVGHKILTYQNPKLTVMSWLWPIMSNLKLIFKIIN